MSQYDNNTPILIVGYVPLDQLEEAVEHGFHLTVYNIETIKKLKKIKSAQPARIHLKLETGTNRQGILESDLMKFLKFVIKMVNLFSLQKMVTEISLS